MNNVTDEEIARIRSKAASALKKLGAGRWFKPSEGENLVRIIPLTTAEPPYSDFYVVRKMHRGFKNDKGERVAPECLQFLLDGELLDKLIENEDDAKDTVAKTRKYGCPACKLAELLNRIDQSKGREVAGKETYDVQVYDPENKKYQIWSVSNKMLRGLLAIQKRKETWNFIDPSDGIPVIFEVTGSGIQRRYTDPSPSLLGRMPLSKDWREKALNLNYVDNIPRVVPFMEMMNLVKLNYPGVRLFAKKDGGK